MGKPYVLLGDLVGRVDAPHASARPRPVAELVLVPARRDGGPDQLTGAVVDALIACERTGAATVLLAADTADLGTPVAAVCRLVASSEPDVLEEARRRFGADRVHAVESIDPADARTWTRELRAAAGRPPAARSRLGSVGGRIMFFRAGYGKMRDRNVRSRDVGPRGL